MSQQPSVLRTSLDAVLDGLVAEHVRHPRHVVVAERLNLEHEGSYRRPTTHPSVGPTISTAGNLARASR